jgi:uncharacterized protein YyaL (SSP411 family)
MEGKYFLWTIDHIKAILDKKERNCLIAAYGVNEAGHFEGQQILNRVNQTEPCTPENEACLQRAKQKLFQVRAERIKPFRNEQIITSWNGLAIGAMAYCYQVLGYKDDYLAAKRAAEFILNSARLADGTLGHVWSGGQSIIPAFLDDYAFLAQGLLDLYEADFNPEWLRQSRELTIKADQKFRAENGTFYLTAVPASGSEIRPLSGVDEAIPSGVAIHAQNLLRLAAWCSETDFAEAAAKIFEAYARDMERDVWGYAGMLTAWSLACAGALELVVLSQGSDQPELMQRLKKCYLPNRILAWRDITVHESAPSPLSELFQARKLVADKPTCYVCRKSQCLPPVTDWEGLQELITPPDA